MDRNPRRNALLPLMFPLLIGALAAGCAGGGGATSTTAGSTTASRLSPQDEARLRELDRAYVRAFLANDPRAVMATLASDAVLIPHHGADPVVGARAIEEFFWPTDGPEITIEAFTAVPDEVGGEGALGYVRGRFALTFSSQDDAGLSRRLSSEGNYLLLARREAGGAWRMTHRIWNDPIPREE